MDYREHRRDIGDIIGDMGRNRREKKRGHRTWRDVRTYEGYGAALLGNHKSSGKKSRIYVNELVAIKHPD